MNRWMRWAVVVVPVVALACGSTLAQEPKKDEPVKQDKKDIIAVAQDAKLATFVDLVKTAGLVDALKGPGPFTVFAPTDEAFKKLGNLDELKKDKDKLAGILKGHVVPRKVDLKTDKMLKTLGGTEITVAAKDEKVVLNDKATVGKDMPASNGVLYTIDAVLTPAAAPMPKPEVKPVDKPKPAPEKKEEPKKDPAKEEKH